MRSQEEDERVRQRKREKERERERKGERKRASKIKRGEREKDVNHHFLRIIKYSFHTTAHHDSVRINVTLLVEYGARNSSLG